MDRNEQDNPSSGSLRRVCCSTRQMRGQTENGHSCGGGQRAQKDRGRQCRPPFSMLKDRTDRSGASGANGCGRNWGEEAREKHRWAGISCPCPHTAIIFRNLI